MIAFKTWIVQTLKNDATLQNYLRDSNGNYNVFPVDIDIQPENFPCIIYQEAGVQILSTPRGMHVGSFQIDVYSINNSLEMDTIYERVAQLLNFKDSTTQTITGTLWWIREESIKDMSDSERRLWRKNARYKFWYNKTDNS